MLDLYPWAGAAGACLDFGPDVVVVEDGGYGGDVIVDEGPVDVVYDDGY